jgi:hypothetical protein
MADLFISWDGEREPGDRLAPEVVDEICLISSQDVCGGGGGDSAIYERFENKGQINGYAALDGTARLPAAQLPLAAIEYKGTWNASSNTPTLSNGAGNLGDIYRVSEAGNSLGFPVEVGDVIFYDGTAWFKLGGGGGGGAVDSVNGKTGVVVLTKADIGLPLADNTADAAKNVLSATKLTPGRNINGVLFDGTADITVPISSNDPALANYQLKSEKGVNLGYASLDAAGKLPSSQLPLSALEYKGVWDAATNTPPLAAGVGTPGDMWRVNVSGTQFGVKFTAGDFALFNGTSWENATSGTAGVSSVAGLTGDVDGGALKTALVLDKVDNTADADKSVASAAKLTTARTINGVAFDGTADIVLPPGVETMAELTDVTPVGLAVGTAVDEAAARDAIDAETTLAKGKPGGYAPLDDRSMVPLVHLPAVVVLGPDGLVPPENLPPQQQSVMEFPTGDDFPEVGQPNVIYIDVSTGDCFRFNPDAAAKRQELIESAKAARDKLGDADGALTLEGSVLPDDFDARSAVRALTDYTRISERVKVQGIEATGELSEDTYLRGDATWSPAYTDGAEGFADRLLDRMDVRAPDSRRVLIEGLMRDLMQAGVWDKLDALYVFAAHHPQAGRLNWKSRVVGDAVGVNSPVFEVDRGFTGDSTTAYLDTGTFPASFVRYKASDASVGVYVRSSATVNVTDVWATPNAGIVPSLSNSTVIARVNASTFVKPEPNNGGDRTGLFAISRLPSDNATGFVYKDGALLGSGPQTAGALPTLPFEFCRGPGPTGSAAYSPRQLSAGFVGAGLTAQEHADLHTALTIYMTAIGAAV